MSHVPWTEIDNFHTVRKTLKQYPELLRGEPVVRYQAKVKLHGTNGGVKVTTDGKVMALSRTSVITPESDNAGFAKWVHAHAEEFASLQRPSGDVVVYGEWCGKGIQKGVAVSSLDRKIFAVFAVRLLRQDGNELVAEPEEIRDLLRFEDIDDLYVLPWYSPVPGSPWTVQVNWDASAEDLQPTLDRINNEVMAVEACDPWIKATFGVEGVGEGLVLYPVSVSHLGYKCFGDVGFKAKGEKHQVVAKTKPVQADPTVAAGAQAFAELVITEARCEQGVRLVSGGELQFEMKNIGAFLKWIGVDVAKETQAELEASGVDPKLAAKACNDRARNWYLENARKL